MTDLQVDDGAKLAEMFIEFADVVELRRNLPNQQLGVGREWGSPVEALVVGFVKVGSEQRRIIIKEISYGRIILSNVGNQ